MWKKHLQKILRNIFKRVLAYSFTISGAVSDASRILGFPGGSVGKECACKAGNGQQ